MANNLMPQPKLAPVPAVKPVDSAKPPQPPKPPSPTRPDTPPAPPEPPKAETPEAPESGSKNASLPDAYNVVLKLPEFLAHLVRDRTGHPFKETPGAIPAVIRQVNER